MSLRFTLTLVLSFMCLATPAWADYQAGLDACKSGDYATALREWRPLAEGGHAPAQFSLGWLYYEGKGVPLDYATAREWFEKAAAQGDAKAQYNLGVLYAYGQGVPQDYVQARKWYEKAAVQGQAEAQLYLGVLYANGQSVPQDYVPARQWWEKAAAQGDALAQYYLGSLYANGQGVPRSVAMKLTGHKTESVYRRYAIVSEADLSDGLKRLATLHDRDAKAVEQSRTVTVLAQS